jgi:hypothetical protein
VNKRLKIILLIIAVGGLSLVGYFYIKYQKSMTNVDDVKKTVEQVGRMMMLPDEVPKVATVTDVSVLTGQKFFRNAQNGDKVLIYETSSKAILYRPKIGKIVDTASVLPVESNEIPSSANNALTQSQIEVVDSGLMTIALFNGTKSIGLTNKFEKSIMDKMSDVEIKIKETAANTDYQQTILIDNTGKFKQRTDDLAKLLEAKVTTLPQGEAKPDTDVVIIFGKSSI